MGQRRKARALSLKCLYAYESVDHDLEAVCSTVLVEGSLEPDAVKFAEALFRRVVGMLDELDDRIKSQCRNWKIDRLAEIDKNILRLAICELLCFPDTPAKVVINEGVELAKKYSTPESFSFVNGILDAIYQQLEEVE